MVATGQSKRRTRAEKSLLSFLVRCGKLDATTASEVATWAEQKQVTVAQALTTHGLLSDEEMAAALAKGLRLPLLNLEEVAFDDDASAYVKEEIATRYFVVPVHRDGEFLTLAMANPFDQEAIRQVEFSAGCRVRPAVAVHSAVLWAIEARYKLDGSLRTLLRDIPETGHLELVRPKKEIDLQSEAGEGDEAPVIKMVNLILIDALSSRASDIHIEPGPHLVQVRFRINGVLEDVLELPKWAQNPTVARIKIMAKLDITERRIPQDGHLRVRYEGELVDFRVSSLPTSGGEKIVMRVLNSATGIKRIDKIGLSDRDLAAVRSAIQTPEGMILVTGPTGSGKTTTLYSVIQEMLSPEINVVTIEHPIEYQIKGISQVDVNEKQGLTFASALRSILRQDPDVILVGEIRDHETAEIAFQAAQTGHLVLSTLHTNDTVATITRLLELGVEHHVLASSLVAIVAQRLVRTICRRCNPGNKPLEPRKPGLLDRGCPTCRGTGFAGRTGVFEVLIVTPPIQKLLEAKASESAIRAVAQQEGMLLLRQDALTRIESGVTTPEEVARVVQLDAQELQCPQCSNVVEEKFSVCPYCLYQLQIHCHSCRAPLKKEWKSCPYCGPAKAAAAASEVAASEVAVPAPAAPVGATAAPSADVYPAVSALGTIDAPSVLIVDDNEELRKIVRMTLERGPRPIHCDEASNGFEALGKVEAHKPHLIILDLMMPGMDGFEVCKRLRAKLSTALIPVIMLTARADLESKELGFLAGTDDYLTKPFDRPELVARVQRLLARTYGWGQHQGAMASATPPGSDGRFEVGRWSTG
jgi:type IV pilus assembly protein PilB